MRLLVTAVVLAGASRMIAQTAGVETQVQKPMVVHTPPQRRPIRRAGAPGTAAGAAKTANVPPTAPVVTLKGICKERQPKAACETVITRDDLDKFAEAFVPDMAPAARGRTAVQYAGTVTFSALAEQQGLDKNPALAKELELQLKIVRMRFLAAIYLRNLQRQTTNIAEADIQRYYGEHRAQFEQVQVRRLAVPFVVPTEDGRPLDHAAVKTELEELRKRAVAGEDLNQLQQEAYKHLHIQATPPVVAVTTVPRLTVQGDDAKALELNPGEVSGVLDSAAALAIVKIESKDPVPVQYVRQEIEATLRAERLKSEIDKLTGKISAQFNLPYLDMPAQPDLFALTAINPPVVRNRATAVTAGTR